MLPARFLCLALVFAALAAVGDGAPEVQDLGEAVVRGGGRRGGFLSTRGSFTLSSGSDSNTAGNEENEERQLELGEPPEELGEGLTLSVSRNAATGTVRLCMEGEREPLLSASGICAAMTKAGQCSASPFVGKHCEGQCANDARKPETAKCAGLQKQVDEERATNAALKKQKADADAARVATLEAELQKAKADDAADAAQSKVLADKTKKTEEQLRIAKLNAAKDEKKSQADAARVATLEAELQKAKAGDAA